jgi:NTP pyrophosphatase (non-canonical NTP hydrolase)
MEFKKLIDRAVFIRAKYLELELIKYGRKWTNEEISMGLVGDVGDLMKIITAKEGVREIDDVDKKLAHELSDCLWSIIILAKSYNVDLGKSFMDTMDDIEKYITKRRKSEKK